MVKVFEYLHPAWGIVLKKISHHLRMYAPEDVVWVDEIPKSDLQIIHIIGTGEYEIAEKSPNKIIWQHCYKTAGNLPWDNLWANSLLSASFHNLKKYTTKQFNFLHLPLGFNRSFFYPRVPFEQRPKVAFVTGHILNDECIGEIYEACAKAGYTLYHTGENFNLGSNYVYLEYLPEVTYADLLGTAVKYVFGLRRVEGFEVAVIEGIASGAVGVVPTLDTYSWYDGIAIKVDVESSNLSKNIYNILIDNEKIDFDAQILKQFEWKNIINKFWNSVWQSLSESPKKI